MGYDMQITRYTDYALRVLIYLRAAEGGFATTREIAESYDISIQHVSKVAAQLVQLGYLVAYRGRNGGVRLVRDANEVNVGKLFRELENPRLAECFSEKNRCVITSTCVLKLALSNALRAFHAELDQYSLQDLFPQERRMVIRRDLHISAN